MSLASVAVTTGDRPLYGAADEPGSSGEGGEYIAALRVYV